MSERCPWPFPGPYYDWNTEDELGSITGQLRSHARLVGTETPLGRDLMRIADEVHGVRKLVAPVPMEAS